MKIIKQFDDLEYFKKRYKGNKIEADDMWSWGLGEDGELYCRTTTISSKKWLSMSEVAGLVFSIADMKRIVKEFGHLLSLL
jgi:hypothetical protein